MTADQFIGETLLNTTAVTAITSSRVFYGMRPIGTTLPAVNYYDLAGAGRGRGIESPVFSINCRAATPRAARDLADIVLDTFIGSDAMGNYGVNNGFAAARVSLANAGGLISEPDGSCYNVPIDIRVVTTL